MHAAGVQDRTRTDPSQTLPRTVTEAPESSPIVLVSAWLFYGLASLGAVYGLIRIGFWVLSKFKREFSSETREGRLAQPFSNYESPPPEGATMKGLLMMGPRQSRAATTVETIMATPPAAGHSHRHFRLLSTISRTNQATVNVRGITIANVGTGCAHLTKT